MQQQDRTEQIETSEKITRASEKSTLDAEKEPLYAAEAIHETEEDISDEDTGEEAETLEEEAEEGAETLEEPTEQRRGRGFDWPALIAALAIAAFFALTARFNSQPAPSYIPAAVFGATGCGLLVTAIHTLRGRSGVGLLEAGLAGLGMALLQFAVAFTYSDILSTIVNFPEYGHAFLLTWGLVALFAVVLSLAGATIGHLVFSPLRQSPGRAQKQPVSEEEDEEEESAEWEDEEAEDASPVQSSAYEEHEPTPRAESTADDATANVDDMMKDDASDGTDETASSAEEDEEDTEVDAEEPDEEERQAVPAGSRPLLNYAITVLLLGLLPMMAGYVFAASYDFLMNAINVNSISPAFYPTLSLLSGLLPWRLAAPIGLSNPNKSFIVFTLLWRIPDSALGNPNLLDVQALETLVFNATGLALLLIAIKRKEADGKSWSWGTVLLLEALFGLMLILPADLWLLRGLEGVLQIQQLLAQLPTLQLLNPALFILNLLTGILFCVIVSLIVKRQYQLWTTPRLKTSPPAEEEEHPDE